VNRRLAILALLLAGACALPLGTWAAAQPQAQPAAQPPAQTAALPGAYPRTVVDDLGRIVTLNAPPERIVAMVPSHTESVCGIGACDRLVGVDRHSDWPVDVRALPTLGDAFAPDLERIALLEPDLVLVDEYSGMHEALENLGIVTYAGTPQTYEETLTFLAALGDMIGMRTEASLLIGRIVGSIEGVAAVTAGLTPPTVFIELDPTPYSAGPDAYLGTLLTLAGGANIVTSAMGPFPLVDPEYVVAADPDVVLLTDAPFGVTVQDVAARPGWANLQALENGRVIELDQDAVNQLSRAGPRMGEAVLLLARILHPDAF